MPPQFNTKSQSRERPTYEEMLWEQLSDTKTEIRETRKELNIRMDKLDAELKTTRQDLNARMERLDHRIDKLEEEIKSTRKELNDNINSLHNELKSSTGHISIANISTVGIALGVLYSIFSK